MKKHDFKPPHPTLSSRRGLKSTASPLTKKGLIEKK